MKLIKKNQLISNLRILTAEQWKIDWLYKENALRISISYVFASNITVLKSLLILMDFNLQFYISVLKIVSIKELCNIAMKIKTCTNRKSRIVVSPIHHLKH